MKSFDLTPLGIPATALPNIQSLFRPRALRKGDCWITPGQTCRSLAFVESGMLRAFVENDHGEQTRWAFLAGQYMTSTTSFGKQIPSEEYIEALEDCQLLEISYDNWTQLCADHPKIQQAWTATLLELYGCFESRVHSLLMGKAEDRYAYFMEKHPEFILHVPQKYVAEMLGIAPRHLSRIRASFVGLPK